jgi:hypothetical protein
MRNLYDRHVSFLNQQQDDKTRIYYKPGDSDGLTNFIFGVKLQAGKLKPDRVLGRIFLKNKLFEFRMLGDQVLSASYELVDEVRYGQIYSLSLPVEDFQKISWQDTTVDEMTDES